MAQPEGRSLTGGAAGGGGNRVVAGRPRNFPVVAFRVSEVGVTALEKLGRTAYVVNGGSATVTPIATATSTAGPPITVGNGPNAIAITPDGKTAYVTNPGSGTVTPIATATNTAGPPITVGSFPFAIAITPATAIHAPAFTSSPAVTAAYRAQFSFTVTTTGDPAPTITRTGRLPPGVRFTDNKDGTATISGIPRNAAAGVYPLTLTARNKNGTATQAFTLTVTRAPQSAWRAAPARSPGQRGNRAADPAVPVSPAGSPPSGHLLAGVPARSG